MKKSLVALAVLGTLAGTAAAQSSVTAFGVLDVNMRYNKAGGQTLYSESTDGNASSRLGFQGVEDLGGGLKAGFWLEAGISPDSGAAGSSSVSGQFWSRRSTVSLMGDFGELRLGFDKTAERTILDDFDPFGTIGVGNIVNLYSTYNTTAQASGLNGGTTWNRATNQVSYLLPGDLGGFYGRFDAAPSEGASTISNKQFSGRFGYKNGPINVTAGVSQNYTLTGTKYYMGSVAGSYDFGVASASLLYTETKYGAAQQDIWTLGVYVPVGQGQFKFSYTNENANSGANVFGLYNANLLAAGYIYNLSKRTALYTTVSEVSNDGKGKAIVNGGLTPSAGGKEGGFEVGVRHSF